LVKEEDLIEALLPPLIEENDHLGILNDLNLLMES
jgi:hypothetical protein